MGIVDGYAHCALSKYKPIENVKAVMQSAGVHRAILVQHLGEYDNTYIGQIVAAEPEHFAGVMIVNHESPDMDQTLTHLVDSGQFKGIRITTEVAKAAPQLLRLAAKLGLIILIYAHDGIADFVGWLDGFLAMQPNTSIVITHMGNPDPTTDSQFEKHRSIFQLTQYPNVYYQISGMKMFCPFPHKLYYDLIAEALEWFGPKRLYWGSNYPVVGSDRDYINDLQLLLGGKLPIPEEAIAMVAGENAEKLWFSNSV